MSNNNTIRITVVGDGATGKTSLLIVYKDKKFDNRYIPTVFDVYSMIIPINNIEYKIILSDTAGQEDFDKLRRFAYKDVNAFIITYAVDERDSYENVRLKWAPELKRYSPKSKIILAGTKIDLRKNIPQHLDTSEGENLAKEIGAAGFIENSSKEQYNINATFGMALQAALADQKNNLIFRRHRNKNDCCSLL